MPNDPTLRILIIVLIIIIAFATAGAIICLVKDLRDAKIIKQRSKELTAAPEKNSYDINLEVYRPDIMGSHIRRV